MSNQVTPYIRRRPSACTLKINTPDHFISLFRGLFWVGWQPNSKQWQCHHSFCMYAVPFSQILLWNQGGFSLRWPHKQKCTASKTWPLKNNMTSMLILKQKMVNKIGESYKLDHEWPPRDADESVDMTLMLCMSGLCQYVHVMTLKTCIPEMYWPGQCKAVPISPPVNQDPSPAHPAPGGGALVHGSRIST